MYIHIMGAFPHSPHESVNPHHGWDLPTSRPSFLPTCVKPSWGAITWAQVCWDVWGRENEFADWGWSNQSSEGLRLISSEWHQHFFFFRFHHFPMKWLIYQSRYTRFSVKPPLRDLGDLMTRFWITRAPMNADFLGSSKSWKSQENQENDPISGTALWTPSICCILLGRNLFFLFFWTPQIEVQIYI